MKRPFRSDCREAQLKAQGQNYIWSPLITMQRLLTGPFLTLCTCTINMSILLPSSHIISLLCRYKQQMQSDVKEGEMLVYSVQNEILAHDCYTWYQLQ